MLKVPVSPKSSNKEVSRHDDENKRKVNEMSNKDRQNQKNHKRKGKSGHDSLYVEGRVGEATIDFLVDSGSSATLINTEIFLGIPKEDRPDITDTKISLEGVNGTSITCLGVVKVPCYLGEKEYEVSAVICDIEVDAILGQDFILQYVKIMDLQNMTIQTADNTIPLFFGDKADRVCRVICSQKVVIPPSSIVNVSVKVSDNEYLSPCMLLEPNEQVMKNRGLFLAPQLTNEKQSTIPTVINFSEKEVRLEPLIWVKVSLLIRWKRK
jgi:hypothetical protein